MNLQNTSIKNQSSVSNMLFTPGLLQRKCSCGNHAASAEKCTACSKKKLNHPLQNKLSIGAANDHFEQEADQVAAKVMQMPASEINSGESYLHAKPLVQRKVFNSQNTISEAPSVVHDVLGSPGAALDQSTRSFMEPRFQQDFSQVRIHTNTKAAQSADAVSAQAYTTGKNIVFSAGSYAPGTFAGKALLAHELAHFVQQQTSSNTLQRKLTVNRNHPSIAPASDPAAALTSAQRLSMMDTLIQALCSQYEVDSSSGEVVSKSRTSLSRTDLASGANPTGCCCLSILTDAATDWTIQVSQVVGPQTIGNTVILSPTDSPVEFGSFTSGNTLAFQGAVPAAGHELCGHAALIEMSIHPLARQDRTRTDVHDPTVNIENLIATEQGVATSDLRGLARSGSHRGESVDRITIDNYALNQSSIPTSQSSKIDFAAAYIITNDSFVDVLGHSDSAGSASAKQSISDNRAQNVKTRLLGQSVPTTTFRTGLGSVNRFTRVEGLSDSQPPAAPLNTNQANWRRTEILISGFPAGAQIPPSGTPTAVSAHRRSPTLGAARRSSDECVRVLARGAYP